MRNPNIYEIYQWQYNINLQKKTKQLNFNVYTTRKYY